jgi:hypothetical protein
MKKLALLALLFACKHEQTRQEAWQAICDAPTHVTSKNPSDVWVWIDEHVTNAEAREELRGLGTIEGDKTSIIRETLAEARVDASRCALLTN